MKTVTYIDQANIRNKRVLLRADFDVSLTMNRQISDDARIKQNIPTINYLLRHHNKVICIAKLGRPKGRDPHFSLSIVAQRLREYLPKIKITLVSDFLSPVGKKTLEEQTEHELILLENIRFYPGEKENDSTFTQQLAQLGDVYINDNFAICHREEASVVGLPSLLPSFGGLSLKEEVTTITKIMKHPKKQFVAIIGGAKVSTKIGVIAKFMDTATHLLIGGALANTFLKAEGFEVGNSFIEEDQVATAHHLLHLASRKKVAIVLPTDVVTTTKKDKLSSGNVQLINAVSKEASIVDIGPETQARFGNIIATAKTIVWNGPVGFIEQPPFDRGTDFLYYSITQNSQAFSVVGGGDTLAAISKKEYIDKITHISTGGGAMLEFIERGTLPGIEALRK